MVSHVLGFVWPGPDRSPLLWGGRWDSTSAPAGSRDLGKCILLSGWCRIPSFHQLARQTCDVGKTRQIVVWHSCKIVLLSFQTCFNCKKRKRAGQEHGIGKCPFIPQPGEPEANRFLFRDYCYRGPAWKPQPVKEEPSSNDEDDKGQDAAEGTQGDPIQESEEEESSSSSSDDSSDYEPEKMKKNCHSMTKRQFKEKYQVSCRDTPFIVSV